MTHPYTFLKEAPWPSVLSPYVSGSSEYVSSIGGFISLTRSMAGLGFHSKSSRLVAEVPDPRPGGSHLYL